MSALCMQHINQLLGLLRFLSISNFLRLVINILSSVPINNDNILKFTSNLKFH